jgi:peptidoglycan/xylan/chitin deacetylase (PgdA/CDA1 family)
MPSTLTVGICAGLGGIAGLGLLAGGCAYAAMSPSSQLFGQTMIAPPRPKELALTFDDGPNPAWTPNLLDILLLHSVKATFFLVGSFAKSEPSLVKRIVEEGHLIGNHSWSHPNLAITRESRVSEELRQTSAILEQITGKRVRYFRPPFGGRRPFVLQAARRLGMTPVTWNAMTDDWKEPSNGQIAERVTSKIDNANRRGFAANIVLHDGSHRGLLANRGPSVAAAGLLLEHYKSTHRFVTLNEWHE